jgi:hypothetical protein
MAGEAESISIPYKAQYIAQKFAEWKGSRSVADSIWEEVESYKYATDTTKLKSNSATMDHTTHIPITMELAQELHALIKKITIPHEDWFAFSPDNKDAAKVKTKLALEAYLKNRHRLSKFKKIISMMIDDLIDKGNCFARVVWIDESPGGYVGPAIKRISPWDIVFNPTASSFKDAPKIIRESLSLGEFAKRAQREGWDEGVVQKVIDGRAGHRAKTQGSSKDKDQHYVPAGYGTREQYMKSGTVEILWFYGDLFDLDTNTLWENSMIVAVDGEMILLEEEIRTWDGKPHIFQGVWQRRQENLWGMGPLDNVIGLNYQINHRENAKSTGLDKLIYSDLIYLGDVEEIYDAETGQTKYLAPEGGGVQEVSVDTTFLAAAGEIERLLDQARKAVGLPADFVGFRTAGEKTFGEVAELQAGAMRPFLDKAKDFEEDFLQPILQAEVELARTHLENTMSVPGNMTNGFTPFIEVSPTTLKANGTYIPQGAARFERKNQIIAALSQLSSTKLMEFAGPHVSGKGVANTLTRLMELEGEEFFSEFAQIIEGVEGQELANMAQQQLAAASTIPTNEEVGLQQEIEANAEREDQDTTVPS